MEIRDMGNNQRLYDTLSRGDQTLVSALEVVLSLSDKAEFRQDIWLLITKEMQRIRDSEN